MTDETTTAELRTPPPTPEEQRKDTIKAIGQLIKKVGNEIIDEKRLEKEPKGPNFAWLINAHEDKPGQSLAAAGIQEAIDYGTLRHPKTARGVYLHLNPLNDIGLERAYGSAYFFIQDFVRRLGFDVPQDVPGMMEKYDSKRNAVIFSDPAKPFDVECPINGSIGYDNKPNLVGIKVVPKSQGSVA